MLEERLILLLFSQQSTWNVFGGMTSAPWIWWISSFKGCNLEEIGCRQPWNFLLWKIAPAPLAIIFLVDFIWKIRHKLLQSGRGQLPPALKGFSWKSSSCMITLHSPSSCRCPMFHCWRRLWSLSRRAGWLGFCRGIFDRSALLPMNYNLWNDIILLIINEGLLNFYF